MEEVPMRKLLFIVLTAFVTSPLAAMECTDIAMVDVAQEDAPSPLMKLPIDIWLEVMKWAGHNSLKEHIRTLGRLCKAHSFFYTNVCIPQHMGWSLKQAGYQQELEQCLFDISLQFKNPKIWLHTLVHAGANIDATEGFGWTPLHQAARFGCRGFVQSLLRAGAQKNKKDRGGRTPAQLAKESRHKNIADYIEQWLDEENIQESSNA